MSVAIVIVVSYIALGIITGFVVAKIKKFIGFYEYYVDEDIDEDVFISSIFWPFALIFGIFWVPTKFYSYLSREIIPAKKSLNEKRTTFQKVINLIEEMPVEDFDKYSWNGLKLRQKKDGKVCSDLLYYYYSKNCWYVHFSDLCFEIPDSIFFRKKVNVLKKKYREFKERRKYDNGKYDDIINQIRENSNLE